MTNQHRGIAAYYPSESLRPPVEINEMVLQLSRSKLFGYFTFEYLSIDYGFDSNDVVI